MSKSTGLEKILHDHQAEILKSWIEGQLADAGPRAAQIEAGIQEASRAFLELFAAGVKSDYQDTLTGQVWDDVRAYLAAFSRERVIQGFSPEETATFIFSLKKPLFVALRRDIKDAERLCDELWTLSLVIDKLGLLTFAAYQRSREEVIERQQEELLDLTTPVVKVWDSIVALPLIGTLDSERTQVVMESLLDAIVANEAAIAIIDITGVPTVDTLVAQHLLKTVAAARLMGAECIISGIRPQIAQTIVHLGVDLGDVATKATLAEALKLALRRVGLMVVQIAAPKTGH